MSDKNYCGKILWNGIRCESGGMQCDGCEKSELRNEIKILKIENERFKADNDNKKETEIEICALLMKGVEKLTSLSSIKATDLLSGWAWDREEAVEIRKILKRDK